jgi:hypothetical protein
MIIHKNLQYDGRTIALMSFDEKGRILHIDNLTNLPIELSLDNDYHRTIVPLSGAEFIEPKERNWFKSLKDSDIVKKDAKFSIKIISRPR